jgi:hypothetical protein
LVQKPEVLNQRYFEIFVEVLRKNTPRYAQAEKRLITPFGTVEIVHKFNPLDKFSSIVPAQVGRWGDYIYFQGPLSLDKVESQVEAAVQAFALNLARAVEDLVDESSRFGIPICYDLFHLSDHSPNLQTFTVLRATK